MRAPARSVRPRGQSTSGFDTVHFVSSVRRRKGVSVCTAVLVRSCAGRGHSYPPYTVCCTRGPQFPIRGRPAPTGILATAGQPPAHRWVARDMPPVPAQSWAAQGSSRFSGRTHLAESEWSGPRTSVERGGRGRGGRRAVVLAPGLYGRSATPGPSPHLRQKKKKEK